SRSIHTIYRDYNKRITFLSALKGTDAKKSRYVHALTGVSFLAEQGESIGVLGRNGSWKSPLMRLIAGKEAPSSGEILVSSTSTLLNVSAALQPRLSGLENLRLGLLAQGLTTRE